MSYREIRQGGYRHILKFCTTPGNSLTLHFNLSNRHSVKNSAPLSNWACLFCWFVWFCCLLLFLLLVCFRLSVICSSQHAHHPGLTHSGSVDFIFLSRFILFFFVVIFPDFFCPGLSPPSSNIHDNIS